MAQRIVRQNGIFTVHNPPALDLKANIKENNILEKIIPKEDFTKELQFVLNQYGVNIFTLFPNLDGLSEYINWFMINRNYWDHIDDIEININDM